MQRWWNESTSDINVVERVSGSGTTCLLHHPCVPEQLCMHGLSLRPVRYPSLFACTHTCDLKEAQKREEKRGGKKKGSEHKDFH
jgi:hypothetical protein